MLDCCSCLPWLAGKRRCWQVTGLCYFPVLLKGRSSKNALLHCPIPVSTLTMHVWNVFGHISGHIVPSNSVLWGCVLQWCCTPVNFFRRFLKTWHCNILYKVNFMAQNVTAWHSLQGQLSDPNYENVTAWHSLQGRLYNIAPRVKIWRYTARLLVTNRS